MLFLDIVSLYVRISNVGWQQSVRFGWSDVGNKRPFLEDVQVTREEIRLTALASCAG
jgi:hypothetical protein